CGNGEPAGASRPGDLSPPTDRIDSGSHDSAQHGSTRLLQCTTIEHKPGVHHRGASRYLSDRWASQCISRAPSMVWQGRFPWELSTRFGPYRPRAVDAEVAAILRRGSATAKIL